MTDRYLPRQFKEVCMKKVNLKIALFYIVLILGVIVTVSTMLGYAKTPDLVFSDVVNYFKSGQVARFVVDEDNVLTMELVPDDKGQKKVIEYEYLRPTYLRRIRCLP